MYGYRASNSFLALLMTTALLSGCAQISPSSDPQPQPLPKPQQERPPVPLPASSNPNLRVSVGFDPLSSVLTAQGISELQQIMSVVREGEARVADPLCNVVIKIVGYAERSEHRIDGALKVIARNRSNTVARWLEQQGISANRMVTEGKIGRPAGAIRYADPANTGLVEVEFINTFANATNCEQLRMIGTTSATPARSSRRR